MPDRCKNIVDHARLHLGQTTLLLLSLLYFVNLIYLFNPILNFFWQGYNVEDLSKDPTLQAELLHITSKASVYGLSLSAVVDPWILNKIYKVWLYPILIKQYNTRFPSLLPLSAAAGDGGGAAPVASAATGDGGALSINLHSDNDQLDEKISPPESLSDAAPDQTNPPPPQKEPFHYGAPLLLFPALFIGVQVVFSVFPPLLLFRFDDAFLRKFSLDFDKGWIWTIFMVAVYRRLGNIKSSLGLCWPCAYSAIERRLKILKYFKERVNTLLTFTLLLVPLFSLVYYCLSFPLSDNFIISEVLSSWCGEIEPIISPYPPPGNPATAIMKIDDLPGLSHLFPTNTSFVVGIQNPPSSRLNAALMVAALKNGESFIQLIPANTSQLTSWSVRWKSDLTSLSFTFYSVFVSLGNECLLYFASQLVLLLAIPIALLNTNNHASIYVFIDKFNRFLWDETKEIVFKILEELKKIFSLGIHEYCNTFNMSSFHSCFLLPPVLCTLCCLMWIPYFLFELPPIIIDQLVNPPILNDTHFPLPTCPITPSLGKTLVKPILPFLRGVAWVLCDFFLRFGPRAISDCLPASFQDSFVWCMVVGLTIWNQIMPFIVPFLIGLILYLGINFLIRKKYCCNTVRNCCSPITSSCSSLLSSITSGGHALWERRGWRNATQESTSENPSILAGGSSSRYMNLA